MKIAIVAYAAVLATIIPSTADASNRQLSNNNNNNNDDSSNNKPKRLRGENAILTTSRAVKRQQRQLERDGIITRGVVRDEEQLSMQPIEDKEPVAIIVDDEEQNTPTDIEQIDCNTMNKKQCKRVAEDIPIPKCSWDGQVCTSTSQVSFLQVDDDACAQYTTQKKCRKNSPCEWQEGEEYENESEGGSCNTPGFVNTGIIKPPSNAPTTYSPTTPYPSYFPTLFPTLSPTLSPVVDLSISMSMMTFLEEEDTKEETNWPTYSPTLSFPTFSPTLSNMPSDVPITSNPTVSPSTFKPTNSPSVSPQVQPIEDVVLEEKESSNECTGLAWRACKRNPLCDIISKNTECYLIGDEGK